MLGYLRVAPRRKQILALKPNIFVDWRFIITTMAIISLAKQIQALIITVKVSNMIPQVFMFYPHDTTHLPILQDYLITDN